MPLIFRNGLHISGKGQTKNEESVKVDISLDRRPENWQGFFTDAEGTWDAIIDQLSFNGNKFIANLITIANDENFELRGELGK